MKYIILVFCAFAMNIAIHPMISSIPYKSAFLNSIGGRLIFFVSAVLLFIVYAKVRKREQEKEISAKKPPKWEGIPNMNEK